MNDDIAGYSFEDLVDAGILRSRTDLARKQKHAGFPMPIKLSVRQAWFPKSEVQAWLNSRIAERPVAVLAPEVEAEPVKPEKTAPKRVGAGAR